MHFSAQNPPAALYHQRGATMSHRIERREAYHDTVGDSGNRFHFAKLEGYGNLTIQVGSTAYLHCPVVNLGERPVSHIFVLIHVYLDHPCVYTTMKKRKRGVFQSQTHVLILLYFQCLCSCRGSDVGTGTYSATASPCLFKTTGFNWRQRTIS